MVAIQTSPELFVPPEVIAPPSPEDFSDEFHEYFKLVSYSESSLPLLHTRNIGSAPGRLEYWEHDFATGTDRNVDGEIKRYQDEASPAVIQAINLFLKEQPDAQAPDLDQLADGVRSFAVATARLEAAGVGIVRLAALEETRLLAYTKNFINIGSSARPKLALA